MGMRIQGKPLAAIMGALMALAFVAVFALPHQAMADELATSRLSAQSAYTNTSLAKAMPLPYNEVYTGSMDYDEAKTTANTTEYEQYWFSFKTSNRESNYAITLDSVNSSKLYLTMYDESGTRLTKSVWSGLDNQGSINGEAITYNRVTLNSDHEKLGKNKTYYARVSATSIRDAWGYATCSRYDQFKLKVQEMRILTNEDVGLTPSSFTYDGTAKRPDVTVTHDGQTLVADVDYYVEYVNNINAGAGIAKITGIGDNYTGEVSKTFTINPKRSDFTIDLSESTFAYDGRSHAPTARVYIDGTEVDYSKDVDVSIPSGCVDAGTYNVSVTGKGNYEGTSTKAFAIAPKAITPTVELSQATYTYDGTAKQPGVTVKDGNTRIDSANYTISYDQGRTNAGAYKVYVTLKGNYSGTGEASFDVKPKSVRPTLTLAQDAYTYDGSQKTPAVTVTVDDTPLADSDYAVTYANGRVDAGSYKVNVELINNYSGATEAAFEIKPQPIELSVSLSPSAVAYDGEAHAPTIKVYADGRELNQETECEVTHPFGNYGVRDIGKYTITAAAKGNYEGSASATFAITEKPESADNGSQETGSDSGSGGTSTPEANGKSSSSSSNVSSHKPASTNLVSLSKAKKTFKATWKSVGATGYKLQYSTSKSFKKAKTVTVKGGSKTSKVVKKLKAKKEYYVRVRAYNKIDGKTYYSAWSSAKSVKTK